MEYVPDLQYEEASKLVKKLSEERAKLTKNEKLLLYYIQKENRRREILETENKDYQDVFDKIGRFIPQSRDNIPLR
jgi:hypothetical protein